MKKLILALAMFAAVPAFAEEANFDAQANDTFSVDEAYNESLTTDRRPGRPQPPRWERPRREIQCVARNFRRQQFLGRAMNQNRAEREALQNCRVRSGFFRGSCRVVSCRAVWH